MYRKGILCLKFYILYNHTFPKLFSVKQLKFCLQDLNFCLWLHLMLMLLQGCSYAFSSFCFFFFDFCFMVTLPICGPVIIVLITNIFRFLPVLMKILNVQYIDFDTRNWFDKQNRRHNTQSCNILSLSYIILINWICSALLGFCPLFSAEIWDVKSQFLISNTHSRVTAKRPFLTFYDIANSMMYRHLCTVGFVSL